jgi:1-acyl-sn-glycerol-3-phosphate acyltransferase
MSTLQSGERPARAVRASDRLAVQAPARSSRRYYLVRAAMGRLARLYSRLSIEGVDRLPKGPSVLCFSHQSWADPFYLYAVVPRRPRYYFFGPEQEDMRRGIRNRLMRWGGVAVPYQPGKRGLVAATIRVGELLSEGCSLAIAGEGRIHSGEGVILPLRDGAAYLTLRSGVPFVPVAINGTSWLAFRRRVRVRVGEPIEWSPATPGRPSAAEIALLTKQAREALKAMVADFPDRPRPGPVGRWLTELFNGWPEGERPPVPPRSNS